MTTTTATKGEIISCGGGGIPPRDDHQNVSFFPLSAPLRRTDPIRDPSNGVALCNLQIFIRLSDVFRRRRRFVFVFVIASDGRTDDGMDANSAAQKFA